MLRHNDVRDNVLFSIEIMSTLQTIKSSLKRSYDKQNLTLVAISYEIYETRKRLVSQTSYKMTTRVRSSFCHMTSLLFSG